MRVLRPGGVVCPLATPLDPDGSFDAAAFERHLDALVADVDGVFVLGSSGEHPWLPADVAAEVAAVAAARMPDHLPLYRGIGEASTQRTLRQLDAVDDRRVDFFVVTPPTYFPLGDDAAVVRHFVTIAEAARRPLVLYNIPALAGNTISPRAVAELAVHPNIAGVKDSAGDFVAFQEMLPARSPTFAVLQGREQFLAASLLLGADGVVSSMANFAPRLLRALESAVSAGAVDEVRRLQGAVTRLATLFDRGFWLCALKAALDECGFAVGAPSAPLPPVGAAQRREIAALLAEARRAGWLTLAPAGRR
jgi:4-hydroxy-tetrahydrodipicolinate synthase